MGRAKKKASNGKSKDDAATIGRKRKAYEIGLVTKEPAAVANAIKTDIPASLYPYDGENIVTKNVQRGKPRVLFQLPGKMVFLHKAVEGQDYRLGVVRDLNSEHPTIVLRFPGTKGVLELQGQAFYPKDTKYLALEYKTKPGKKTNRSLLSRGAFQKVVIFSQASWRTESDEGELGGALEPPEFLYKPPVPVEDYKYDTDEEKHVAPVAVAATNVTSLASPPLSPVQARSSSSRKKKATIKAAKKADEDDGVIELGDSPAPAPRARSSRSRKRVSYVGMIASSSEEEAGSEEEDEEASSDSGDQDSDSSSSEAVMSESSNSDEWKPE